MVSPDDQPQQCHPGQGPNTVTGIVPVEYHTSLGRVGQAQGFAMDTRLQCHS